jgi:ABC-type glycerol-3-phosphate transport system substrate-binding protein
MKKYTFILAIGAILALTACGSGSTTNETTDSTATEVEVDTATTSAVDTTSVVETPEAVQ